MTTIPNNILITARNSVHGSIAADGRITSNPRSGNNIYPRYNWTALGECIGDEEAGSRPLSIHVPSLPDGSPDADGIRRAVEVMRAAWGDLHIQDNSGTVPDLDQGLWGAIARRTAAHIDAA